MNLEHLYDGIMQKGMKALQNHAEVIDHFIGDEADTRMGITLVIRPSEDLKKKLNILKHYRM